MAANVQQWLSQELSDVLGFGAPDSTAEMAAYVLTMKPPEAGTYFLELLGDTKIDYIEKLMAEISRRRGGQISTSTTQNNGAPKTKQQSTSYMGIHTQTASSKPKRKKGSQSQKNPAQTSGGDSHNAVPEGMIAYSKSNTEFETIGGKGKGGNKDKGKAPQQQQHHHHQHQHQHQQQQQLLQPTQTAHSSVHDQPHNDDNDNDNSWKDSLDSNAVPSSSKPSLSGSNRHKYVNLFSKEGEGKLSQLMPGRNVCGCNCIKHALINNCIECGRIVCTQEGVGPCMTCGAMVVTPDQQEILERGSRKSEQLMKKMQKDVEDGLKIATDRKNKLLHFQNTSAKRMHVIDDESDYFSHDSNQWLNQKERMKVKRKEQAMRDDKAKAKRTNMIQIDLFGRTATEYDASQDLKDMYSHDTHQDQNEAITDEFDAARDAIARAHAVTAVSENPYLDKSRHRPEFVSTEAIGQQRSHAAAAADKTTDTRHQTRLQDTDINKMQDQGMCMSMHQPWASLLVHGIKQHEGRSWYSAHRGKLWIAATAKPVDPDTVKQLDEFYKDYHGPDINLPTQYPSSCVLGCVDVADVAAQEDYRVEFPEGESQSPFVFICENPQVLNVYFPVKGKPKIWKLEKDVHDAAKAGVYPAEPGQVRGSSSKL